MLRRRKCVRVPGRDEEKGREQKELCVCVYAVGGRAERITKSSVEFKQKTEQQNKQNGPEDSAFPPSQPGFAARGTQSRIVARHNGENRRYRLNPRVIMNPIYLVLTRDCIGS